MAQNIICEPVGFILEGLVAISFWGGGYGTMPMYSVEFDHEPSEQEIRNSINDGGMGCEYYMGAVVRLDTIYTHGAKIYGDAKYINLSRHTDEQVQEVLELGHPQSNVDFWEVEEA